MDQLLVSDPTGQQIQVHHVQGYQPVHGPPTVKIADPEKPVVYIHGLTRSPREFMTNYFYGNPGWHVANFDRLLLSVTIPPGNSVGQQRIDTVFGSHMRPHFTLQPSYSIVANETGKLSVAEVFHRECTRADTGITTDSFTTLAVFLARVDHSCSSDVDVAVGYEDGNTFTPYKTQTAHDPIDKSGFTSAYTVRQMKEHRTVSYRGPGMPEGLLCTESQHDRSIYQGEKMLESPNMRETLGRENPYRTMYASESTSTMKKVVIATNTVSREFPVINNLSCKKICHVANENNTYFVYASSVEELLQVMSRMLPLAFAGDAAFNDALLKCMQESSVPFLLDPQNTIRSLCQGEINWLKNARYTYTHDEPIAKIFADFEKSAREQAPNPNAFQSSIEQTSDDRLRIPMWNAELALFLYEEQRRKLERQRIKYSPENICVRVRRVPDATNGSNGGAHEERVRVELGILYAPTRIHGSTVNGLVAIPAVGVSLHNLTFA